MPDWVSPQPRQLTIDAAAICPNDQAPLQGQAPSTSGPCRHETLIPPRRLAGMNDGLRRRSIYDDQIIWAALKILVLGHQELGVL
jgi:hypothetical protein